MNNINCSEKIGRYIYSKNHYRISDNTVKHAAFMPQPDDGRLSVFIISGLSEEEIWSIGESIRNENLKARADITANHVYESRLDIKVDNNPQRHAEIINWPEDNSARKLLAMELAQKSILQLKY